jgi:hypothetical protein
MARKPSPPPSEEDLRNPGLWSEFFGFIRENKKWWLIPLIVMLVLIGGLLLLAGQHTALAPFIYTLF